MISGGNLRRKNLPDEQADQRVLRPLKSEAGLAGHQRGSTVDPIKYLSIECAA